MSKFTFSKTNLSKYCIVYPKYNMSYLVTLELEKLRKAVKKITDKDIIMYPDNKEHAYLYNSPNIFRQLKACYIRQKLFLLQFFCFYKPLN